MIKVADAFCCSKWRATDASGVYATVYEVAMHGVSASVGRWRQLLGFETFSQTPVAVSATNDTAATAAYRTFLDAILRQHRLLFNFDPRKNTITHGSALWNMDQRRISAVLSAVPVRTIVRMRRTSPAQRLESWWPLERFNVSSTIDVHIYASKHSALKQWERNRQVLVRLLPPASLQRIDTFVTAWLRAENATID